MGSLNCTEKLRAAVQNSFPVDLEWIAVPFSAGSVDPCHLLPHKKLKQYSAPRALDEAEKPPSSHYFKPCYRVSVEDERRFSPPSHWHGGSDQGIRSCQVAGRPHLAWRPILYFIKIRDGPPDSWQAAATL